ncbi:MAG: hypothetical protein H5T97_01925, partial [Firmicutes bacterium]|nr:hypothetical protein [Bacillota bacterium]
DLCPECRGQLWDGYYHPEGGYFFLFPPGEELIPRGTLPARGCHRCLRVAPPPQGGREGTSGGLKG